jgi:hypothetical protein
MRHLFGFVLALAISAALFFGVGLGIWRISALGRSADGLSLSALGTTANLVPLAALLGAGLLIGAALLIRRASPLGTGLPGLALLGWSGVLVMRGRHVLAYVPMAGSHFGAGFAVLLGSGALALMGAVMIIPLFLPSRWRRAELDDYIDIPAELGLVPYEPGLL